MFKRSMLVCWHHGHKAVAATVLHAYLADSIYNGPWRSRLARPRPPSTAAATSLGHSASRIPVPIITLLTGFSLPWQPPIIYSNMQYIYCYNDFSWCTVLLHRFAYKAQTCRGQDNLSLLSEDCMQAVSAIICDLQVWSWRLDFKVTSVNRMARE